MSDIQSDLLQNQISDAKSGIGIFDLPCGYIDASGVLHKEIVIREMTGEEEDLLSSTKTKPNKKMNGLMSACIERIGTITDKGKISYIVPNLLIGDRVFIIFAIRRVSVGDEYNVEETCPSCNKLGFYPVDLSALDIIPMPDPMLRSFTITLASGTTVKFHTPSGLDEQAASTVGTDEDQMSRYLIMRLDEIDGKRVDLQKVKKLKFRDRNEIRAAYTKYCEGGVDTGMDFTCDSCEHVFKKDLNIDGGFFFPSLIPKR